MRLAAEAEIVRDGAEHALRVLGLGLGLLAFLGDQRGVLPDRLAVGAPVEREGPARQGLAGIPLALAVVQQAARREALAQAADQLVGERRAWWARRRRCSTRRLSKSSIETKVGSPPMVRRTSFCLQRRVDLVAQRVEALPAFVGEGLGDPRMLGDPRHLHVEGEVDVGEARKARDRRGVAVVRRRGERDVALAGQEARGRVEPDPAGAGQIDLAPGVEVGEIDGRCRAGRRATRGRA